MTTINNGDGTETVRADGKGKRKGPSACQCIVPADKQTDEKVWAFKSCKETCNNIFKQGHDAKLKGQLIKAFRAGVKLNIEGTVTTVQALAKHFGFERYLTEKPVRKSRSGAKTTKAAKAVKGAGGSIFKGETVSFTYRNGKMTGRVTKVDSEGVEVVFTTKGGKVTHKTFKRTEVKAAA